MAEDTKKLMLSAWLTEAVDMCDQPMSAKEKTDICQDCKPTSKTQPTLLVLVAVWVSKRENTALAVLTFFSYSTFFYVLLLSHNDPLNENLITSLLNAHLNSTGKAE